MDSRRAMLVVTIVAAIFRAGHCARMSENNSKLSARFRCFTGIAGLLLALAIPGCERKKPQATIAPPAVAVMQPVQREIVEWDEYIGRLESPETVEVRARVSGYLDKVHFKEGKEVKKGDPLFTIDPRPYQAEYGHVEAEHQRAVSQTDLARNDFERAKRLIATKAISEEDYDTKSKTYASTEAAMKSAKAAMDLAKLNLEFTQIHSPIDGRISRALVTEGNLISSGISGSGATLLTTIVSLDPLYCYADPDERAILKYLRLRREGTRASARDEPIPIEMGLAEDVGFPHLE